MLLVLDIDGTIGDLSHREHMIDGIEEPTCEQWDAFLAPELVAEDIPLKPAALHYDEATGYFDQVIFLTSRPEYLRETTAAWLKKHFKVDVTEDTLFMRPDGDLRTSAALKKEALDGPITDLYGHTAWVLVDDEPDNLSVFKEFGLAFSAEEFWNVFELGLEKLARVIQLTARTYEECLDEERN